MAEVILIVLLVAIAGTALLIGDLWKKNRPDRKRYFPPAVHVLAIIVVLSIMLPGIIVFPFDVVSYLILIAAAMFSLLLIYAGALYYKWRFRPL